jgi:hypothetical protein
VEHAACVELKQKYPEFQFLSVAPNDSAFDTFIREYQPDIVQYERFIIEEQFGWRVFANQPRALQLLDTSDLHFLRRARGKGQLLDDSLDAQSLFKLEGAEKGDWLREMASILRVRHSFLVSDFEEKLLQKIPGFPTSKVSVLRWGIEAPKTPPRPQSARSGVALIGNFRHPPNRESVHFFRKQLWPQLRQAIPDLRVDIYGAYPSREDFALHRPEEGFNICGHDPREAKEFLGGYLALLVPLAFGAGIKGKVLDAWAAGTPVLTTEVGAEGLALDSRRNPPAFAGLICQRDDPASWVAALKGLKESPDDFSRLQASGLQVLKEFFDQEKLGRAYLGMIERFLGNSLEPQDFFQELLQVEERHAKRALSRYIELKESLKP